MASDVTVSGTELISQWEAAFGQAPPPYLSIPFMTKALACQAQCKRAGGLPAQTRRALQQIASGKPVRDVPMNPNKVGTHYVREWSERAYQSLWLKVVMRWMGGYGPRSQPSPNASQEQPGPARASSASPRLGAPHEEDPLRDLYSQEL